MIYITNGGIISRLFEIRFMLVILKHAICQFYHIGYLQHIALMRLVFTEQMLDWCTLEVGCCVLNCAHQKCANIIKQALL